MEVPLGNNTALNEEIYRGWKASPKTRSTSEILYTCIVTISLCVYTAIHLNIPGPNSRFKWFRKVVWVLVGIIGPEYVLWTAFVQFLDARRVVAAVNEEHDRQKGAKAVPRTKAYLSMMPDGPLKDYCKQSTSKPFANLRYGFFVVMGGFRVDVSRIDDRGRKTMCITPAGCILLANLGILLPLDNTIIDGRKRANGLAKLLVCFEVLWLAVQCIARKVSGLPMALLELHTFVHVVCAIFIYILWFRKPFDIDEAAILPMDRDLERALSFLYALSDEENSFFLFQPKVLPPIDIQTTSTYESSHRSSKWEGDRLDAPDNYLEPRVGGMVSAVLAYGLFSCARADMPAQSSSTVVGWEASGSISWQQYDNLRHHRNEYDSGVDGQMKDAWGPWESESIRTEAFEVINDGFDISIVLVCERLPRSGYRSFRARVLFPSRSRIAGIFQDIVSLAESTRDLAVSSIEPYRVTSYLADECSDWGSDGSSKILPSWQTLVILCSLACIYGAVHLAAWQSHFPTVIERLLWRISGICIAGGLPLSLAFDYLENKISELDRRRRYTQAYQTPEALKILGYVVAWGTIITIALAYFFARVFLVVESFIELRAVPIGVYAAVGCPFPPHPRSSC
jgi:hypothetical protein